MTEFSEQPHARARGRVGEDDAVRWLAAHGFEIVERNVVNHGGEIDVVAKEGATLCFIEIKARDGKLYGPAIAAVTPGKQRRLSRAASLYIAIRGLHRLPARFDVLGLDREGNGWRYTLVRNAFPYSPGPARRRW
ncbi:MAG TPA: YraN family protein [Thermoanaerobaculia bacterium]|nr:YraN family protein [Thermoanaerobaculia bacterium]